MVPKKDLIPPSPRVSSVGILAGTTASGKSSLSLDLARKNPQIEIINADSMLVYRGMNIGTAKPTSSELKEVPHHLVDIRNPDEPFTAGEFMRAAMSAIEEIHQRGKRALIVGGTGFYLKALLFGLWSAPAADPELRAQLEKKSNPELFEELSQKSRESADKIGPTDRYRLIRAVEVLRLTGKSPQELQSVISPQANPLFTLWITDRPNTELYERIRTRTVSMIEQGWVEEVKDLLQRFPSSRALSAVGYSQVCDYLLGKPVPGRKVKPGIEGLSDEIQLATRQLVKSQRTWFRGQTKSVSQCKWFILESDQTLLEQEFNSVYAN